MSDAAKMSPNRPYLLRALHEWISDNGLTPYLLVDASQPGLRVPPQSVKDGQVVLNIAPQAVAQLNIGNDWVRFLARFGGVSQSVDVPVSAVLAIYAQENGKGMMFPAEDAPPPAGPDDPAPPSPSGDEQDGEKPRRNAPHLRVIK